MSRTVLVATEKPFAPESVKKISGICSDAGYTLKLLEKYTGKASLLQAVKEVDALIIRSDKVTADVLAAAKNLKVVVRAGSGYDNVDCSAASKNKVVVMNTPGQHLADGAVASQSPESLFRNCDYISLNLPLNETTQKLITFNLLSKTKTGASVVNTARKEIIDEDGLLKMMEKRPDFMYASDIAPDCREKMRTRYPDRCIFTLKKMGAQTLEANINAGSAAIKQVINFLENGDTTFQVN